MVAVDIPVGYGYVVLSFCLYVFVMFHLGGKVAAARKKYNVNLPTMYVPEDDEKRRDFNCVQRGHQNAIESAPLFGPMLFVAGLGYPYIAAGAGLLYSVSREVYASGYSTGVPKNRYKNPLGAAHNLSLLALTLLSGAHAVNHWL